MTGRSVALSPCSSPLLQSPHFKPYVCFQSRLAVILPWYLLHPFYCTCLTVFTSPCLQFSSFLTILLMLLTLLVAFQFHGFHCFFSHYLDQTSYHFCIFLSIASFFLFPSSSFSFHLTTLHGKYCNSSFLLAEDVKILSAPGSFPLWSWLQAFRTSSEMIGLCNLGSDLYKSCIKPFQGLSPFIWKLLVESWPLPEFQPPLFFHLLAGPGTCTRALTRGPGLWLPCLLSVWPHIIVQRLGACASGWGPHLLLTAPSSPAPVFTRQPPSTQPFLE